MGRIRAPMLKTKRRAQDGNQGRGEGAARSSEEPSRHNPEPERDQAPEQCRQCGAEWPQRRRLKLFCCYACREQFKALSAVGEPSGLVGSKHLKQIRALRRVKRLSVGRFAFSPVNAVTWR